MKKSLFKYSLLPISLLTMLPAFSAIPIHLSKQYPLSLTALSSVNIKEISRATDFNNTLHIRIKQTHQGYPVWGGDAVMHVSKVSHTETSLPSLLSSPSSQTTLNGIVYQRITEDLINTPSFVFNQAQASQAIKHSVAYFQKSTGANPSIQNVENELMVFIDKKNKAHWAFKIRFDVEPLKANALPEKPTYILDAITFEIYAKWNDIKTAAGFNASGGGYGGNKKMGKLVYDGLKGNLPELDIKRDSNRNICYLENDNVIVKNKNKVVQFACNKTDPQHNKVYWDGSFDAVNGGYSPSNDALYGGAVIKDMYEKWYHLPVLVDKNKKAMKLTMVVHVKMDNAYWDGKQMTFGDGISVFYPLTSLGVAAHEISHGFTEQHSDLVYEGQSGGINEAFSDMAAQAAEFYAFGHNSWQIGPEIFKAQNEALRYMDEPSKDCLDDNKPGNDCSIDNASQYEDGLDVHFSSGVYNHLFYLLANTDGWDTRKAFDVMVQANLHYWLPLGTFSENACGIIAAASDYSYDVQAVLNALQEVQIDTSSC